ncbi:MAG: hypothetical protein ACXW4N_11010 [Candidatus Deferrimicrobiaceae bacterium]
MAIPKDIIRASDTVREIPVRTRSSSPSVKFYGWSICCSYLEHFPHGYGRDPDCPEQQEAT